MPDFHVAVDRHGPCTLIVVSGELDALTRPSLRAAIDEALGHDDARLLFDLSELRFIDSSGLRLILDAYVALGRSGDRVAVCGLTPRVARVFHLIGLDARIQVHPDRDSALLAHGIG